MSKKQKRSTINDLKNILETIEKIDRFIENMDFEDFSEDEKTLFAVSKAIEIIGEIVNHLPQELKDRYSLVPWEDIYGMRNFLVHNYFGSDQDEVWKTINEDIPDLKPIIQKILSEEMKDKQTDKPE